MTLIRNMTDLAPNVTTTNSTVIFSNPISSTSNITATSNVFASNVVISSAPTIDTHAMRRQDIGYELIAGNVTLVGSASVQVTIPAGFKFVRIRVHGATLATGNQGIFVQAQLNGTYPSGASATFDMRLIQTTSAGIVGSGLSDTSGSGHFIGYTGGSGVLSAVIDVNAPNDGAGATTSIVGIGYESTTYGWNQVHTYGLNQVGALTAIRIVNSGGIAFTLGTMAVYGARG